MDVARFKYPPHWVPLTMLFDAMKPIDTDTGMNTDTCQSCLK
jgi:glutathione gamma-glutamylcysteinyltransferase